MQDSPRGALIQDIQKKRGSKVITYVTGDRPSLSVPIASDAVPILHEHILAIDPAARDRLDLLLYSRGGESDVPWGIVSMFREYCNSSFSVLIPYRAHSAATVIALGADEIIMTRKGELGPIDATLSNGPYNPREESSHDQLPVAVEDVMGYFALLDKLNCQSPEQKLRGFEQLTAKVHPLVLGSVSRQLEQTQLVALKVLGTRAEPFPAEQNEAIVKRLSSEIGSHGHSICASEAVGYFGLRQVVRAEEYGLEDALWGLYREYRALLSLEQAFRPEEYLIANELEEHCWSDLNVACIESEAGCDVWKVDMRVRKVRQVPPQVAVNLNNFGMPTVNVGNLPKGITPQQFWEMMQGLVHAAVDAGLSQAIDLAVKELLKSFPITGFERTAINSGWVRVGA